MFGLDQGLAGLSDGTTILVVILVAILLGLRHASDPDHLAAVTTLITSGRDRTARRAAGLGLTWGLGHATSLFVFGVPIVLYRAYLPESIQRGAETAVGLLIVALAAWLLLRWHRGAFHAHRHGPPRRVRRPWQAYAIGLVHGTGGSAGVGILLLASIHDHVLALAALAVFAVFTAFSMALLSTGFGLTLGRSPRALSLNRLAPALGLASLAFGIWYALGAQNLVPYYF
jgi:high-affinity nickel permease